MIDNNITLFCAVEGMSSAFSVDINPSKTVDHLRKLIKAEKANDFGNIDADRLTLWCVSIPAVSTAQDSRISLGADSATEPKKLDPTDDISDVFKETLPKKSIHIIVQLSSPQSECPAKTFSSYIWKEVVDQYGIQEMTGSLPEFNIQPKSLSEDEITVLSGVVKNYTEHNRAYMFDLNANEATRSTIVNLFMVSAILFNDSNMVLAQQQRMKGLRGHGSVDFAVLDRFRQTQALGVTEVKKDNLAQGLAQNLVQLDVAVQQKKHKRVEEFGEENGERPPIRAKSYGIVTDSFKWTLVECTLDEKDALAFRYKGDSKISSIEAWRGGIEERL
ncbi:hypothetical protein BGW38_007464 [Lunasporangiospora selenospora]|uniref:Crinkler effector protein N-terminal domain-containing protein n=1 Tax=Lunasporangiospora selenospora TaxID=979761 RepID=A0A9P6FLP5_9FUNG|nr:hypothetical protein BGW38_007464 [Lunasporangiospora selenospora]